jgi:hypothetical protein
MTAEKFVPDGLSGERGGRLYRTGDRGRWREEGWIEFLGRLDEQVKLRGYRIELGEIETAVREYPGVEQVAVAVQTDTSGERRLVGYVVEGEGIEVEESALREHVRRRVPEYMVPWEWVKLAELPRTAHGKLDPKRLPTPKRERPELKQGYVAPRNVVEELVAAIWAEVLQVERVGVNDNFFALGGHSLMAMRVAARIRAIFGTAVSVREIFDAPSIPDFSKIILKNESIAGRAEKIARLFQQVHADVQIKSSKETKGKL